MTPARKGKIARLPLRIREEVCERLLDGEPGSQILPWLNGLADTKAVLEAHFGGDKINDENLSAWRTGGYQDWLKDHEKVESVRQIGELSFRMAKASGGNMSEGLLAIAAGKIQTLLEALSDDGPERDEKGNPLGPDIGDLVSALANVRGLELDTHKTRLKEIEVGQKGEQIALEKKKFQRTTCELFLKWFDNARAREIAEGKGTKETKVAELIQLWFGEMPEGIGPKELQKPKKEAK